MVVKSRNLFGYLMSLRIVHRRVHTGSALTQRARKKDAHVMSVPGGRFMPYIQRWTKSPNPPAPESKPNGQQAST